MNQEFNLARNVYLDRDAKDVVRQLVHTHAPVRINAGTPQLAAASYLQDFGDLFGLASEQLENLGLPPSDTIENAPVEYRFLEEKHQFDTSTVAYDQTDLGIPVWQAGIAVQMKLNPFRVLSSQSTLHPDLEVKAPDKKKAKQAESMKEEELAALMDKLMNDYSLIKKAKEESKTLSENAKSYFTELNTLRGKLVPVKEGNNAMFVDEENVREKITDLYYGVSFYQGRPTDSQIQKIDYLRKEIDEDAK